MFSVRVGRSTHVPAAGVPIWLSVLGLICLLGLRQPVSAQSAQTNPGPVTVSGQVINSTSGQPVPRALVRLGEHVQMTNYEGRFEFPQVTDNGTIQVTKPGFSMSPDLSSSTVVYIRTDQISGPVTVRIYPEALITVQLTGPDGEPLQGVSLSAQRVLFDGSTSRWMTAGMGITDSHGNARIPVTAGDYRLTTRYIPPNNDRIEGILPLIAPAQTSTSSSPFIHLHSGEETHLDLHPQLRHTYPVNLRIEGLPLQSTPNIVAMSEDGSRINLFAERSLAPGTQRITLPNGSYTLSARAGDQDALEMAETNVTVSNAELSGVVLNFMPVPSIPVSISVDPTTATTSDNSNASPPSLNQLGLFLQNLQADPESGSGQVSLVTRNGGSFFTVPFGTYRLKARSGNQWYIKSATYGNTDLLQNELVSAPGAGGAAIRLVVSNDSGTVQGTTSLGSTAAGAWIYMVSTTPSLTPIISMRSREDGSFSNSRIPPGSYRVLALEQPRQIDFSDPAVAAPFSARMQSTTVEVGMKSSVSLDIVPFAELYP